MWKSVLIWLWHPDKEMSLVERAIIDLPSSCACSNWSTALQLATRRPLVKPCIPVLLQVIVTRGACYLEGKIWQLLEPLGFQHTFVDSVATWLKLETFAPVPTPAGWSLPSNGGGWCPSSRPSSSSHAHHEWPIITIQQHSDSLPCLEGRRIKALLPFLIQIISVPQYPVGWQILPAWTPWKKMENYLQLRSGY